MQNFTNLLGIIFVILCLAQCHSQTLYAPSCNECNGTNALCTPVKSVTYVSCTCKDGFVGNGLNCTKKVFCSDICCEQGYYFDMISKTCQDKNECAISGGNKCLSGHSSDCLNIVGNYLCINNKSRACPINACDDCLDCIIPQGLNTPQCVDPCDHYSWLDGSTRHYSINSTRRFLTDRYNVGWFRYKNGMGIKNGCVGPLKCNSLHPFSLNDSLPTIEEGVKMVPLIINSDKGCRATAPIPVKACSKDNGYYVYKFSGSMSYNVYCTDFISSPIISSASGTQNCIVTTTAPTTTTSAPTMITDTTQTTAAPTTSKTSIDTTPIQTPSTSTTPPMSAPTTTTSVPTSPTPTTPSTSVPTTPTSTTPTTIIPTSTTPTTQTHRPPSAQGPTNSSVTSEKSHCQNTEEKIKLKLSIFSDQKLVNLIYSTYRILPKIPLYVVVEAEHPRRKSTVIVVNSFFADNHSDQGFNDPFILMGCMGGETEEARPITGLQYTDRFFSVKGYNIVDVLEKD